MIAAIVVLEVATETVRLPNAPFSPRCVPTTTLPSSLPMLLLLLSVSSADGGEVATVIVFLVLALAADSELDTEETEPEDEDEVNECGGGSEREEDFCEDLVDSDEDEGHRATLEGAVVLDAPSPAAVVVGCEGG